MKYYIRYIKTEESTAEEYIEAADADSAYLQASRRLAEERINWVSRNAKAFVQIEGLLPKRPATVDPS